MNDVHELHLAAKLFRVSNPLPNFKPEFERIRFVKSIARVDALKHKPLAMFSGAFIIGATTAVVPFSLAVSLRNGIPSSGLSQFAFFDCRLDSKLTAYLSVLDYLEAIGEFPPGSRAAHSERVLGKRQGDRAYVLRDYPAFCERAAKDLPYDLSLEVLRRIEGVAA